MLIIVTTETISGKNLETLGLAKGSVVRAKHIGKDLLVGFKSIVGGELGAYTELMYEARNVATERMMKEAKDMNADGIVAVRYETAAVMNGACEVMAYGTAVKFI